jgi:probable F420-dependent oxidoreductase
MLELSAERSLGAHPYFVPAAHTRWAREQLGEGPLLAPEVACVIDPDAESGRAAAREYARSYLALTNYVSGLRSVGFTDEDLAGGGSDRLIDAVVPHGTAEAVAAAVRQHLDAGADHVCVQPIGGSGMPRDAWTALADALR